MQSRIAEILLQSCGIADDGGSVSQVERERPLTCEERTRYVDLVLTFQSGQELHIENKIDRTYEDVLQLKDELSVLRREDHLLLICPRGISLLQDETRAILDSDPRIHHVRWLDFANKCMDLAATLTPDSIEYHLLSSIAHYWPEREKCDFLWMCEAIVEENQLDCLYADDFEEAFRERFGGIYDMWVSERGERGNGGARQLLTQKLSGLRKKSSGGLRLELTGNERPPRQPDWGFQVLYEYRVVRSQATLLTR